MEVTAIGATQDATAPPMPIVRPGAFGSATATPAEAAPAAAPVKRSLTPSEAAVAAVSADAFAAFIKTLLPAASPGLLAAVKVQADPFGPRSNFTRAQQQTLFGIIPRLSDDARATLSLAIDQVHLEDDPSTSRLYAATVVELAGDLLSRDTGPGTTYVEEHIGDERSPLQTAADASARAREAKAARDLGLPLPAGSSSPTDAGPA